MLKNKYTKLLIGCFSLAVLAGAAVFALGHFTKPPKTEIAEQHLPAANFDKGKVTTGQNLGTAEKLRAGGQLTYESEEIATNQPNTNVVGIRWDQAGGDENVSVEIRTFDGQWSQWTALSGTGEGERKDGTPATHAGLLITKNAQKVQYRLNANAPPGESIEINKPLLTAIDATKGPDPTKQNKVAKFFGKVANAAPSGPRIYNRAEWGCPEATSSPSWGPEYRTLNRFIVHHTAAVNNGFDPAGAIRGIWQYHTYSQGWGDIGYNYIVDINGNIFQGRYYDENYARSTNQDVVGGHTYGNNYGTSGIAALGNFTDQGTTNGLVHNIGVIAAWKASFYAHQPSADISGHRDNGSTNCPGNNLYGALPTIRGVASSFWQTWYVQRRYDYSFQGEGVNGSPGNSTPGLRNNQTATAYVDLKNEGEVTWSNSGANPVRLATLRPRDRGSAFAQGWLSSNRVATFNQKVVNGVASSASTIAPGETARFNFSFKGAQITGSFQEYFGLIAEGAYWFPRDLGLYWVVNSQADTYKYQWLRQSNPTLNQPNQTGTATVTIKNTGNMPWSNAGSNPLRLGTERPKDRVSRLRHSSWISGSRVDTFAGKAQLDGSGNPILDGGGNVVYDNTATIINPGEAAHFTFTVQTPNGVLTGNEYFNFVAENQAWLNDVGLYWPVSVGQNYHAQWVGQSAHPTIDKSDNPIGLSYFDYKNTGSYPWQVDGVVRLATSNPLDRGSGFATFGLSSGSTPALPTNTDNWLTVNRVGTYAGKVTGGSLDTGATVINPGEAARFTIALDARNIPSGTYREYFRLVADGFAWLEDYGAFQNVTVQP